MRKDSRYETVETIARGKNHCVDFDHGVSPDAVGRHSRGMSISELGFYTRSVEDIREEQFERIAGKYSARVLLNLNNTENETYFKDTNFRYGVVEASNYEELEKLDLNQQSTYVQSNFDEKVSLDNLHLFQCNMNADTSIYVDNSVLGGYYHCVQYQRVQK